MPAEHLERIFDPFFTTKEAGTGLGLPVVRRIAREHGGRAEVENHPGEGAVFRLWLPIWKEVAE
jgi:signal transduction histidine kinase